MIRSMTGHGQGTMEKDGRRATVEVRSVNHRFLDVKLRGASLPASIQDKVEKAVQKRLDRGSVSVLLRDEGALEKELRVDVEAAKNAHAALDELRATLGIEQAVTLELVAAQSGVLRSRRDDTADEALWAALAPALDEALDSLCDMRKHEGRALTGDVTARLVRMEERLGEIEVAAKTSVDHWAARLDERIKKLVAKARVEVDAERMATEVALLADRADVTEEIVRLRSHFEQTRALLSQDQAVGRRFEFLIQEMGREINTIGSKSQSGQIASWVIEVKAELEKIREQAQNVE